MSATTAGAIKAHLEGQALGLPVFRDAAPKDQPLPFIVVQEGISLVPDNDGDLMDPDADHGVAEQAQVSLFQPWRTRDGKAGERPGLPAQVIAALHGAPLPTAPTRVYGMRVTGAVRLPRYDAPSSTDAANAANVVQDTITVTIRRDL